MSKTQNFLTRKHPEIWVSSWRSPNLAWLEYSAAAVTQFVALHCAPQKKKQTTNTVHMSGNPFRVSVSRTFPCFQMLPGKTRGPSPSKSQFTCVSRHGNPPRSEFMNVAVQGLCDIGWFVYARNFFVVDWKIQFFVSWSWIVWFLGLSEVVSMWFEFGYVFIYIYTQYIAITSQGKLNLTWTNTHI